MTGEAAHLQNPPYPGKKLGDVDTAGQESNDSTREHIEAVTAEGSPCIKYSVVERTEGKKASDHF